MSTPSEPVKDPYLRAAAEYFNVPIDQVTPDRRAYIKHASLASRYSMGPRLLKDYLDALRKT